MRRTPMFQTARYALLLTALAGLVACNSESTTSPIQIGSIRVTGSSTSVAVGNAIQLQAVARDPNGVPINGVIFEWSSANNAIATVGSTGLVTGVAAGSTDITAEADGIEGSLRISVQPGGAQ